MDPIVPGGLGEAAAVAPSVGMEPTQAPQVAPATTTDAVTPLSSPSPEQTSTAPSIPSTPSVDWQQRATSAERELQQFGQLLAQAQREAQEQQAQNEAQSRREQAYAFAANLDPDAQRDYIRRFEDQERANLLADRQRALQAAQQQQRQMIESIAAPLYAQEVAKNHGLPPEYVELLKAVPPQMMDAIAPQYAALHRQNLAVLNEVQNLRRDQAAATQQATGAYSAPGTNGTPVGATPTGQTRRERDAAAYRATRSGVVGSPS